jgi:hypothetical protein
MMMMMTTAKTAMRWALRSDRQYSQTTPLNNPTTSTNGRGSGNNNGPEVSGVHGKAQSVNRSELRKQKLHLFDKSNRPSHFYNRVVKPVDGTKRYFFVLRCSPDDDDDSQQLRLVPLEVKGTCIGQHIGRPKYQCIIGDTDENFLTVSAKDYQVVAATAVRRRPLVADEAWDIEDDDDDEEERPTKKKRHST